MPGRSLRVRRPVARLLRAGAVLAAAGLLALAAAPWLGHRVVVLAGPSMAPTHPAGAALLVREGGDAPTVGDVVTYRDGAGHLTTHRVVEVAADATVPLLRTRGDANPSVDPAPVGPSQVLGVVVGDLGPVGHVLRAATAGRAARAVPGVLALALVARELRALRRRSRLRRAAAGALVAPAPGPGPAPGTDPGTDPGAGVGASRFAAPARVGAARRAGERLGTSGAGRAVALVGALVVVAAVAGPAGARFGTSTSLEAPATTTARLGTPTGLAASVGCRPGGGAGTTLAWDPDPLEAEHDVRYVVLRDGLERATVEGTSYVDPTALLAVHGYRVVATLGAWRSDPSPAVTVTAVALCL